MSFIERAQHFQQLETFFHKMDPRAKMTVALLYSVCCPLINNVWILASLTLATMGFMVIARLGKLLCLTMTFSFIPFLIYIPIEAWLWNKSSDIVTYFRLYVTITPIMYCGMILGFTTSLDKMMAALEKLQMPKPVRYGIMVALRYLVMMESEAGMLFQGLKVRSIMPRFSDIFTAPMTVIRLIVVPMLIRSFKVADQMAAAAELKGVSAPTKPQKVHSISFALNDAGFVILNVTMMVTAWVL